MRNTITNILRQNRKGVTTRKTLQKLLLPATVAIVGILFASSWNVVPAEFEAESGAPAWSLDGAWMMRTITDWGPVLEPIMFTAQDNAGQRYTMLMEDAECWYTLMGAFPTATDHSHLVGVCANRTAHL